MMKSIRQKIKSKWIDFLKNNPKAFKKLVFSTRVSQELFNAICHQENLEHLATDGKKEVIEIYDKLIKLPKLNYGFVIECPEMFKGEKKK